MKTSQKILLSTILLTSFSVSAMNLPVANVDASCTASASDVVNCPVANVGPTAVINEPFADFVNVDITFNGTGSFDTDGTITNYNWNFGDGHEDTGSIITHAFDSAGSYNILLTVFDNDGASNSISSIASISAPVVSPVPLPAAVWLFGAGIVALVGVARRKG